VITEARPARSCLTSMLCSLSSVLVGLMQISTITSSSRALNPGGLKVSESFRIGVSQLRSYQSESSPLLNEIQLFMQAQRTRSRRGCSGIPRQRRDHFHRYPTYRSG